MRQPRTGISLSATAVALLAALGGLAGCSSSTPSADASTTASPPALAAPLNATLATSTGEVAVVAMGTLGDPLNTFWQLFVRSSSATSPWTLVTPPGVADNGGLVVSATPGSAGSAPMLAGFQPSQGLAFSPLALSVDQGGTWSPGLVPGGLAPVPDALATSPGGAALALVRARGGEVFRSSGDPSVWSELVGQGAIASSGAGRSCGVGDLTAAALDATRGALVGTTCTASGVVGLFGAVGGSWHLLGPRLSTPSGSASTKVLRLVDGQGMTSGLVAVRDASSTSLIGVASAGGAWSGSAPLVMGPGDGLVSTGVEPNGGFVVLLSRSNGALALDMETGPAGGWRSLPAPPPATATVAVGIGGEVDALAVASTKLTDWQLDGPAGTWSKIDTVTVPIQFGSSA
jgi:hypothetical protein